MRTDMRKQTGWVIRRVSDGFVKEGEGFFGGKGEIGHDKET